mgnify:CR=1 FL=1
MENLPDALATTSYSKTYFLNIDFLKAAYHLNIKHIELRQVARQQDASGILLNATHLRECILNFEDE